jgi:DNA polymerase-3 subunit delta'
MLEVLPRQEGVLQEPDRFGDAPHPREMLALIGHAEAEAEILTAIHSGRMHHAWLITGEEGIGKATFAYRVARFLLASTDTASSDAKNGLAVPARSAAAHQIAANAHPDLAVIRRGWSEDRKRMLTEISIKAALDGLELFHSKPRPMAGSASA